MKLTIFNDLHIGAIRTGGTTPESALRLRSSLTAQTEKLIDSVDNDLMILGDLFDSYSIPLPDLLATYNMLSAWLARGHQLYAVCGNHDLSKSSVTLSSMQFLCQLLQSQHRNVHMIDRPTATPHGYVIPHLVSQQDFDTAIEAVPACDVLYLHCNVSNNFAKSSDHSLNLSPEQLAALPVKHVVCAHEHQTRKFGKVLIPGNQIPSSISDCLGTRTKSYAVVENGVPSLREIDPVSRWYAEVDWRNATDPGTQFVRFIGSATAEEGVLVATAVAEFRRSSAALVVGNAVEIAGTDDSEEMARSVEQVGQFDVMGALRELLTPAQMAKIEALE